MHKKKYFGFVTLYIQRGSQAYITRNCRNIRAMSTLHETTEPTKTLKGNYAMEEAPQKVKTAFWRKLLAGIGIFFIAVGVFLAAFGFSFRMIMLPQESLTPENNAEAEIIRLETQVTQLETENQKLKQENEILKDSSSSSKSGSSDGGSSSSSSTRSSGSSGSSSSTRSSGSSSNADVY